VKAAIEREQWKARFPIAEREQARPQVKSEKYDFELKIEHYE
jgi:hypothetical protein